MTSPEIKRQAAELVRRTCAKQGLPLKIRDPVVLQKIATIIRGGVR